MFGYLSKFFEVGVGLRIFQHYLMYFFPQIFLGHQIIVSFNYVHQSESHVRYFLNHVYLLYETEIINVKISDSVIIQVKSFYIVICIDMSFIFYSYTCDFYSTTSYMRQFIFKDHREQDNYLLSAVSI